VVMLAPGPRFAGFEFQTISPRPDEVLPRMDLAALVGFAERGPLNTPVAIEDAGQFQTIFGGDVALAWDLERNEQVSAYLGPAVRAFFRNGGRRCWVVRVAGSAATGLLPLPGVVRLGPTHPEPAFVRATSEGSWSDGLRVGTALTDRLVDAIAFDPGTLSLRASVLSTDDLVPGDLIRVSFPQARLMLFWAIANVRKVDGGKPSTVLARGTTASWFSTIAQPSTAVSAYLYTTDASITGDPERGLVGSTTRAVRVVDATWPTTTEPGAPIALDLALDLADAPDPGAVVRVEVDGGRDLWLAIQQTDSPAPGIVRVTGPGLWWLGASPPAGAQLDPQPLIERLTFEVSIWKGSSSISRLADLGFAPDHFAYIGNLPTDRQRYAVDLPAGSSAVPSGALLAACGPMDAVYLPIGVAPVGAATLSLGRLGTQISALERDGLAVFGPQLFLDPALADTDATDLQAEADFLRLQSPNPRELTGIHAAFYLDEVTLLAVPDAAHRGWTQSTIAAPLQTVVEPAPQPPSGSEFRPLHMTVIDAPDLSASTPDPTGTFDLSWSAVAGATYLVEESDRPDWSRASVVYDGADNQIRLYGRAVDDYYFRARAAISGTSSDWSNTVIVRVQPVPGWNLNSPADFASDGLLAIHQGALRMCRARGDVFALLTMPEHFREGDAAEYTSRLTAAMSQTDSNGGTYGGMYYPWLLASDVGSLEPRSMPVDGHMCGQLAAVALTRGAWNAPANIPLAGALGLTRPVPRDASPNLLQARINILRQDATGCVAQTAYCLSQDAEVQVIVVRRLLSLIRRLALRQGAAYVFEPNNRGFLRRVQSGFEGVLNLLFTRGALAGSVASEAFQVVVHSPAAADPSVAENQLAVELRVAPALPLTFLTVRLLQTNTGVQVQGA
jgi:Phage tail sheath protein subtilisin-like domain